MTNLGTIMPAPWFTGLDHNGHPIVGGRLYTFAAGTSLPLATYTDVNLSVPHENPIILDGAGRVSAYLSAASYKFVLKNADDVVIRSQDNINATAATPANTVDISNVAGETIAAGQVVYLSDGSGGLIAGRWYLADSDLPYASSLPIIGIAPNDIPSAGTGTVRLIGKVDTANPLSPGATYYVADTPGSMSTTPGANVRVIGVADSTNSIVIIPNPPPAWVAPVGGGPAYSYTYQIVPLTDAASVALDCALSAMDGTKIFFLNANGDRTIAIPTNAQDGMRLIIMHFANTSPRTLTLSPGVGGFNFGSDIPGLTTTAAGKIDYVGCIYNGSQTRWDVVAYVKGL